MARLIPKQLYLLAFTLVCTGAFGQVFDSVIPLGNLGGQRGLSVEGTSAGANVGIAIEGTGDYNGDGFADLVLGAPGATVVSGGNARTNAGEVYVVFGGPGGIDDDFDLNRLRAANGGDGSLGFMLLGEGANHRAGTDVANAGDMNGDGIDDLMVGAIGRGVGFGGGFINPQGTAYLIFGRSENQRLPAEVDLAILPVGPEDENPGIGVVLTGNQGGARVGNDLAALGDINGDGLGDMVIGNNFPIGGFVNQRAEIYAVYGRPASVPWPAQLDLFSLSLGDGSVGFTISDVTSGTNLGSAVDGIGDFTGDGIDDLLVGAYTSSELVPDPFAPGGREGAAIIIPGRESGAGFGFGSDFDMSVFANQPTVHRLLGPVEFDQLGKAVAGIGDINGDGRPDIAIGGRFDENGEIILNPPPVPPEAGLVWILYGRAANNPLPEVFELGRLHPANGGNGSMGFAIGVDPEERLGSSISGIGDVNGDGMTDLLIGASSKFVDGESRGGAYVLFGRASDDPFPALVSLTDVVNGNGSRGFSLNGEQFSDLAGNKVSAAGDLNGDGSTDFLIGAQQADAGLQNTGRAYAVFGAGDDVKALTVDGTLSRAWYDPARSGEGVMTDFGTLNGQPAFFGAWYTYLNGEQQWFAVGPVVLPAGATSFESDLILTDGGAFGDAFDPGLVNATVWGSVRVTVDECDRLSWDYSSTDGSQTGNLDFIPLLPDTLGLAGCRAAVNKGLVSVLGPEVSGTYWNASRAGEGVIIDIENRGTQPTAFVSWFTYANGVQQWLVGSGPMQLAAGALIDIPMVVTDGGQFGSAFDPSQVNAQSWGTVSLSFSSCNNAELEYSGQFPGGDNESGSIALVRFNGDPLDLECID